MEIQAAPARGLLAPLPAARALASPDPQAVERFEAAMEASAAGTGPAPEADLTSQVAQGITDGIFRSMMSGMQKSIERFKDINRA